jgi:hypothetical protein
MIFYLPNLAYQPVYLYIYQPIGPKLPTYLIEVTYLLISYNYFSLVDN